MCKLEETTFTCGHKQYALTSGPCDSVRKLKNAPADSPPEFCIVGFEISKNANSPMYCKKSCRVGKAIDTVNHIYEEATKKLDKIAERASAIGKCILDKAPTYDFAHLEKHCYDPKLLAQQCEASYRRVQQLLAEFVDIKKSVMQDFTNASGVAKSSIRSVNGEFKHGETVFAEMVSVDIKSFEGEIDDCVTQLRDAVLEIERCANDACLEELGWTFPTTDKEQCEALKELGQWKMGVAGSSWMDKAYFPVLFDCAED